MKTKKIEVLAPAGNPAALKAAVFAGADAVYMGGSLFSARASAVNFSREEMREAVLFARERNVRVYVTVNTLLKDDELPEALDFCKFLCSVPVDGILIQDMGLFNILREACPGMPLHASTQMSLHTPGGAALLKELGASRVVLAREMSLKEIEEVSKKTDVELEAFVHGALCMSLSGQCYFSAMLGGRSGNRGRCAQTCRLPFAAPGGTGHDLSLKDMSFIDHIETLHNAGVCSAKIEGRMKRPEYVAAAVAACRKAADGEPVPENLLEHLNAVFSRSGFTDGYLSAHRGRIMFGTRTKEDVESANSAVFAQLHTLYKKEAQRVPVTFTLSAFAGENPRVTVSDGENEAVVTAEDCVDMMRTGILYRDPILDIARRGAERIRHGNSLAAGIRDVQILAELRQRLLLHQNVGKREIEKFAQHGGLVAVGCAKDVLKTRNICHTQFLSLSRLSFCPVQQIIVHALKSRVPCTLIVPDTRDRLHLAAQGGDCLPDLRIRKLIHVHRLHDLCDAE